MHAITTFSLSAQMIAPALISLADQAPHMSYRLNRAEGTVSLIIRENSQFDGMSAVLSFSAEPDCSRPYSFKPSDGLITASCDLNQNGEVVGSVVVGSMRFDHELIDDFLNVCCRFNQNGEVVASATVGPASAVMEPIRPNSEDSASSHRVLKARCDLNQHGVIVASRGEGLVGRDRPAVSGDWSSGLISLPRAHLRDERASDVVASRAEALVTPDSPTASGDWSPGLIRLPRAHLRDEHASDVVASRAEEWVTPDSPAASGELPSSSLPRVRNGYLFGRFVR